MQYMLCIIFVLFFSNVADKKESKFCLFLCAAALSLFCGLRAVGTGVDTSNYYNFLSYIRGRGISFGSDIGFSAISYILMGIFNNPYYPLLIFAFVTNFLIVFRLWDFRDKAPFSLMILIYMTVHYPYTFNIVRQFLAISIIFWGTRYIEREEYVKYVILNVLASTIHTSSLMCFSFLSVTFGYKAETKKYKLFGFGVALVFILASMFLFSANVTKYEKYFTISSGSIHAMTIFKILCFLLVIISNNVFKNDMFSMDIYGDYVPMQRQIPIIYFSGLALAALGMLYTFMNRIGFYFMMFEMPFWGQAARATINKRAYQAIIFFIVGYILLNGMISGPSADNLFYYQSFLAK